MVRSLPQRIEWMATINPVWGLPNRCSTNTPPRPMKPLTLVFPVGRFSCRIAGLLALAALPLIHTWWTAPTLPLRPVEVRPSIPLWVGGAGISGMDEISVYRRQREFLAAHRRATILVFPVRTGNAVDTDCALTLARRLSRAEICQACAVGQPLFVAAAVAESNTKALWELARVFRDEMRKSPSGADYTLFVDYVRSPEASEWAAVRFVLCDARGEWVFVDQQDLNSPEYRDLKPTDKPDCNDLVVRRLADFLRSHNPSVAEPFFRRLFSQSLSP